MMIIYMTLMCATNAVILRGIENPKMEIMEGSRRILNQQTNLRQYENRQVRRINPAIDFGDGNRWTVRFHIDQSELNEISNLKFFVPTSELKLSVQIYPQISFQIVLRKGTKFIYTISRDAIKLLETLEEENNFMTLTISNAALCRLRQNVEKQVLRFEDTHGIYGYTPNENSPYLEYTSGSVKPRVCRGGRVRRSRNKSPPAANDPCGNPYELMVDPNQGLNQNAVRFPGRVNIGTCINPDHHLHPTQRPGHERCDQETLLRLATAQCHHRQSFDYFSYRYYRSNLRNFNSNEELYLLCTPVAFHSEDYIMIDQGTETYTVTIPMAKIKECDCM